MLIARVPSAPIARRASSLVIAAIGAKALSLACRFLGRVETALRRADLSRRHASCRAVLGHPQWVGRVRGAWLTGKGDSHRFPTPGGILKKRSCQKARGSKECT